MNEKPVEVSLPEDMTQERFEALFKTFNARNERKNERARERYRLRKEGKIPPKTGRATTWILPHTRAHDLMKRLAEQPVKPKDIPDEDSYQFLRLLRWNVIYISTFDGHVWLNQPVGDEALELLDQDVTATIYAEA